MNVFGQLFVAGIRFVIVLLRAGGHSAVRKAVVHVGHLLVGALFKFQQVWIRTNQVVLLGIM